MHEKEKDEEAIKVYDGNQGLRRRQFRPVVVSKLATVDEILRTGLKAFHITKPTENYYLTDAYDETARLFVCSNLFSFNRNAVNGETNL